MSFLRYAIKASKAVERNPVHKGRYGEMVVSSIFHPVWFGDEEHYLINNLYIRTKDNKTHQIDHVLVYKNGIFCIETKNIKGLIIGNESSNIWTSFNNNRKTQFVNPIKQNEGHVKALNELLNERYPIISVVVFAKSNKPSGVSSCVVNLEELEAFVKDFKAEKELNNDELKDINELLINYQNNCNITKADHLKSFHK